MQAELVVAKSDPAFSSGAVITGRASARGAAFTADRSARFQEAVLQGNVFCATDQGTGGQMPAGLSASPITVSLYNPASSGKIGVIWYASLTSKVAPAAASVIWIAANTNTVAAATTGTAASTRNALIGSASNPVIQALTTATLPAAPVAIMTLGTLLTGAITVQTQATPLGGFIDGGIVMYPGSSLSFQSSTISGAAGCHGSWIWEEISLPA